MCAAHTEDRNRNGYVTVFNPATETYQPGIQKPKGNRKNFFTFISSDYITIICRLNMLDYGIFSRTLNLVFLLSVIIHQKNIYLW